MKCVKNEEECDICHETNICHIMPCCIEKYLCINCTERINTRWPTCPFCRARIKIEEQYDRVYDFHKLEVVCFILLNLSISFIHHQLIDPNKKVEYIFCWIGCCLSILNYFAFEGPLKPHLIKYNIFVFDLIVLNLISMVIKIEYYKLFIGWSTMILVYNNYKYFHEYIILEIKELFLDLITKKVFTNKIVIRN